jgi:hypothetical protein
MAGDIVCGNAVVEGIARVISALEPADPDFIADLWRHIADPSRSIFLSEATGSAWHSAEGLQRVANRIMERIARFPKDIDGDEAIRGIQSLVKHSSDQNLKSNVFTVFTTLFLRDHDQRIKLLQLIKEADDIFGDLPDSKFHVIINAMNGRIGLQGNWYQLLFSRKKGFDKVAGFEVTSGTRERGIDVVLKIELVDANDPIFFELKAGPTHYIGDDGAAQMFYHVENPPIATTPNGWRRYRMVINTEDINVLLDNGGKFLDELTTTTRYRNPPWNTLMQELDQSLTGKPPGFNFEEWVTQKNFANPGQNLDDPHPDLVRQAREFIQQRFFQKEFFEEIDFAPVPPIPGQ